MQGGPSRKTGFSKAFISGYQGTTRVYAKVSKPDEIGRAHV